MPSGKKIPDRVTAAIEAVTKAYTAKDNANPVRQALRTFTGALTLWKMDHAKARGRLDTDGPALVAALRTDKQDALATQVETALTDLS